VLSTSLYFVVFGQQSVAAWAPSMASATAPSLSPPHHAVAAQRSVSNASFGIYLPKWSGTIFELLSAPVSYVEVLIGYVGAATTKSVMLGILILVTARLFVPYGIAHPSGC